MRIFSYNVSWKNMTGVYSDIAQKNVAIYIDSQNDLDFITLQEATNNHKIIEKSNTLTKMKYVHIKQGNEELLTFWNDSKFHLYKNNTKYGDITPNRPYLITFFKNRKTKEQFCIVNAHFGHHSRDTFLKLLASLVKKVITKINRIIIVGDFNIQISHQPTIDVCGKTFYTSNRIDHTCCGEKLRVQFDNAIDTKDKLEQTVIDYKLYASDHIPIIYDFK